MQGDAASLDEQLIAAHRLEVRLEMQLGRYDAAVARLRILVVEHPLVETFLVDLVESLYRAGRRSEAITTYHVYRSRIRDELGVEPAPQTQQLYLDIIADGPI